MQYIPPSFPNHPQNKRETQNKKQNRKDIEDHSRPRCNVFEPFVSFDQSYHLAPLYSVKGVHNVAPIEHSLQTFHRSLRVPRYSPKMRLASSTARMMVSWSGLFITVRNSTKAARLETNFRSRLAVRFYVSETIATRRAFCP